MRNSAQFEAWGKRLSMEEVWDWTYQVRPYLEICTESELRALQDDSLRLSFEMDKNGRVSANRSDPAGTFTMQKLWHIRKEFLRRGFSIDEALKGLSFPYSEDHLDYFRSRTDLAHLWRMGNCFSRVGDERWMRELFDHGNILLRPATYYKGHYDDIARQDDEMRIETLITPYDFDLGRVPYLKKPRGWYKTSERKPSDHYIYCLSTSLKPSYFVDFCGTKPRAEAAVVIHSIESFVSRLMRAVSRRFFEWQVQFSPVRYVDFFCCVHNPVHCKANPYFAKNARFLYQGEYRMALIPPMAVSHLPDLPLSIGPIHDIAELLVL